MEIDNLDKKTRCLSNLEKKEKHLEFRTKITKKPEVINYVYITKLD